MLQERAEKAVALQRLEAECQTPSLPCPLHNKPNDINHLKEWKTDNMIFVILLYSPVLHFWVHLDSSDGYLYVLVY